MSKPAPPPFRKPAPIPGTTAEDAFIKGAADQEPASPPPHRRVTDYPWDHANPKYKPHVQLRTPEPLKLKLDFLAERHAGGHRSMQEILIYAVEQYVAELLAEELAKEQP
jgi:hypothetical protein